ncbi:MAG: hypothetical protein HON47_05100 [Candidatus Diapherotrites archaeon]|jgi:hypothetical protein|uniref:Uncharacterized protein n=1 Tax=Candidatus Iainarchaeum sp. TaxID=3101447 RepID=A0A8T5GHD0_9ARCH|nr:hypothetical protein [Candidatus Diapherotrites archaeon]
MKPIEPISMEETEELIAKLMKIILKNKTFPSPRNIALMARKLMNHKNNVDSNPNNAPSGVDITEFKQLLFDEKVKEILYDIGKFDKSVNFVFPEENLLNLAKKVIKEELEN